MIVDSGSNRPPGGGATKSRRGGPPVSVASRSRVGQSTYGGASRTMLSSASRRHVSTVGDKMKPETKPPIQVCRELFNANKFTISQDAYSK